ncbi:MULTISPECIES: hypothetical protein [unclassified Arthrobacter]|uniref:hypothetical protein n=1 Tax=unclassified Arthrobacter TaxID=235627 RepID=UPI001E4FA56B|nr:MULTISPECIES: hypothetical protein [unclassified Arthrobacter]MCC9145422.1 hypothetical protein [Arthrobacter sp. zg-Y919]MDK1276650.1 hypothetical protein [Arthrobacter sp. zg.Y919]MDM7989289.1 hypothetical protein [Arthrobacter sp. zg-Y877]WIB04401.1 hypothetical protein QNO10_07080 [Arthrobacter sp. zg-Y919]
MSIDPRIALQSLITAFEEHLAAAAARRGDKDPVVESAYLAIADAFEVYEEVLYDAYGEVTPLEIYEDDEDDADYEAGEDVDEVLEAEPGRDSGDGDPLGRSANR